MRAGAADTAHERDPSGTQPPQPRSVGIAPQPAAATFSPQAGRRDMPRPLAPSGGGECGVQLAPLVPSPRLRGEGAGRRMRGGRASPNPPRRTTEPCTFGALPQRTSLDRALL
ncbi:hypothetical protein CN151_16825 [Sinorhizobium meliloti]|nr:hypothetical protein CN151_16825 [Sinorhizobium meliloti]RVM92243.1 hypothetical protein CN119_17700 [Sinorhizobium meliloti]